jgi:hypothetical protein
MKKILIGILMLSVCRIGLATNQFPTSATARYPVVVLNAQDIQLLAKLNNQIREYLNTKRTDTLNTLGNFIQNEIIRRLNALYASFVSEIEKAQTTDVSRSAVSHPERDFNYLRLFFNTLDDSLESLLKTYNTHSTNRALAKQQSAAQKSATSFNQEEEYYALQRNIFIPFNDCKKLIDKATRTAVSKLLERVNL